MAAGLFKKLRKKLDYFPQIDIDLAHRAYQFAYDAHAGQTRVTGEPYITHPVAVAAILADLHMDKETIIAGLLHDVLEDTAVERDELEKLFGPVVASLVDGLSKLTQIKYVSKAQAQAESFCKMILAMSKDIRVMVVKLADRLHNMRTLESLALPRKQRIAKETLEIYAPIAKRLGMRTISVEMEELCFSTLHPIRYRILKEGIRKRRGNRKKVLAQIAKALNKGIEERGLPTCMVSGREKHFYSIYRKMRDKQLSFTSVMDVYAFRVITEDEDTCYRVLGLVHSLYKPVPERFKDYIAIPKVNGYQSLHTTLFGPYGLPIEVQIRTSEMDRMATNGVAAHWLYKMNDKRMAHSKLRAQKWANTLMELQAQSSSPLEFMQSLKEDLFSEEVYVFTPTGMIRELPAGSTPIDFAYAVHTDVGNHCVSAKIDRQLSPLSSVLVNGQTVEIITKPAAHPAESWLGFVKTSKARSCIRHFLKGQHRNQFIALGLALLRQSLDECQIDFEVLPAHLINDLCQQLGFSRIEHVYEAIGNGEQLPDLVVQRLRGLMQESHLDFASSTETQIAQPLLIKGTEGVVLRFSSCCSPIPGDPIVGVLEEGRGIGVHAEHCRHHHAKKELASRAMDMRWSLTVQGDFEARLAVQVCNDAGVLAVLARAIAEAEANIEDIAVQEREGKYYIVLFKLLVKNRIHLARVMRTLRRLNAVNKISRVYEELDPD